MNFKEVVAKRIMERLGTIVPSLVEEVKMTLSEKQELRFIIGKESTEGLERSLSVLQKDNLGPAILATMIEEELKKRELYPEQK